MSKSVDIDYESFCNLIASNVQGTSATAKSVDKYLKGIYKTILRQLEINKKINFKNFGCFEIKERKEDYRLINNPSNNTKYVAHIKPKFVISFNPSEVFNFCVNENNFKYHVRCEHKLKIHKYKKRRKERTRKRYNVTHIADLLNVANQRKEWIERNDDNG